MYKSFATLLLAIVASALSAQIQVDTTNTPEELVFDFLLGNGVLIENPQVSGSSVQYGSFSNDEYYGLDSGLVLSTSSVLNLMGTGGDVPFGESVSQDPDLLEVANSVPQLLGLGFGVFGTYDVVSFEFDFVPYGDSLAFNFVFGSDEYFAWENTSFNDVFAFFVSGPGIEGPYSAPPGFPGGSVNIAYVPNSIPPLPITVSSVNAGMNAEYFNGNGDDPNINVNGFTDVFTASLGGLQEGETYHIRLAMADGSDTALQSVVMLEAGSFSAFVTTDPGAPGDFNADGLIDVDDLLTLLGELGCQGDDCTTDLNEDGVVTIMDLLLFLELFG